MLSTWQVTTIINTWVTTITNTSGHMYLRTPTHHTAYTGSHWFTLAHTHTYLHTKQSSLCRNHECHPFCIFVARTSEPLIYCSPTASESWPPIWDWYMSMWPLLQVTHTHTWLPCHQWVMILSYWHQTHNKGAYTDKTIVNANRVTASIKGIIWSIVSNTKCKRVTMKAHGKGVGILG